MVWAVSPLLKTTLNKFCKVLAILAQKLNFTDAAVHWNSHTLSKNQVFATQNSLANLQLYAQCNVAFSVKRMQGFHGVDDVDVEDASTILRYNQFPAQIMECLS